LTAAEWSSMSGRRRTLIDRSDNPFGCAMSDRHSRKALIEALRDHRDLPWLAPRQLFDVLPVGQTSYAKLLDRLALLKSGHIARNNPAASPSEADEFRSRIESYERDRARCEAEMIRGIHQAGAEGIWLALGRCGLGADEEIIEQHCWDYFLRLDFIEGVARDRDGKICFAGIRCLLKTDLPTELSVSVATKRPHVSERDLREFLTRPDVAALTRPEQREAACQHFDPRKPKDRQFRRAFREDRREPGARPKERRE
jgi:hypothetical protein